MVNNHEAEQAVLGSVLAEGPLIKDLTLLPDHFASERHARIFEAMLAVSKKDDPLHAVSVATELGDSVEKCGGVNYFLQLAESVASTGTLKHYQRLVLEAYKSRKAQAVVVEFSKNPDGAELGRLIADLSKLKDLGVDQQEKGIADHLQDIARDMISPPEENDVGYKTGYKLFDDMTGGGPQRGELFIVAARPSMGKTAFALNMASSHCSSGGSVDIFSYEMGARELLQRMISAEGHISGQKWRTFCFNEKDYEKAMDAMHEIIKWDVSIRENAKTVSDIRAQVRESVISQNRSNHMVVIDYLQLITPIGNHERRDQAVGEMTRELKLLARELNIPIILLSQLSRGVESRQEKRPLMSDLRESGNIEQDADVVAFLYRDEYYNPNSEFRNMVEVILRKQRNGPIGTVELAFFKEYGKFLSLDYRSQREEVPSA